MLAWHASLFPTGRSGMVKIRVGAWRDDSSGPMQVVSGAFGKERVHYVAPAAKHLNAEMRAFLDWFNDEVDIDPVLKAGLAHLWFVTIHPFDDGNGRIARAVSIHAFGEKYAPGIPGGKRLSAREAPGLPVTAVGLGMSRSGDDSR